MLHRTMPTYVGVGGVHSVTVAAVGAAGHVPHVAVLLPAGPAPQPPGLLELHVELVDVIILHPPITSSETSFSKPDNTTPGPNFVGLC